MLSNNTVAKSIKLVNEAYEAGKKTGYSEGFRAGVLETTSSELDTYKEILKAYDCKYGKI